MAFKKQLYKQEVEFYKHRSTLSMLIKRFYTPELEPKEKILVIILMSGILSSTNKGIFIYNYFLIISNLDKVLIADT